MKFSVQWAGALALALAVAFPAAAADKKAEAAILKIEQALIDAQTVDETFVYFDPDVVMFDAIPGVIDGLPAMRRAIGAEFAGYTDFKGKILRMKIDVSGKMAFAYSVEHFEATPKVKGALPPFNATFRQTDCYHKVKGKWLIIHQHISFPMDPKTGQAVLNGP